MATPLQRVLRWFGFGSAALAETGGPQHALPGAPLGDDVQTLGPDRALQLDTVWSCLDRRATTVAGLPLMVYEVSYSDGRKKPARGSRLWGVLHDSPNSRMTPFDFWRVMLLNHDLRGNAYARIDRDERTGECVALWPMPADQVRPVVLNDGAMVYEYRIGSDVAVLAENNVLHLRNLGNGTVGMDKLTFMRSATDEAAKAQSSASRMWGNGGKATGVLTVDKVLNKGQREQILEAFSGMALGSASRLYVLEADMKYQQISLTPEQMQLLESRRYSTEQFCRWYDVPPVLVHHNNVTTWGSGIEQILDGFHKLTIRPMLVNIEQALRKRVMTPRQRASMAAEWNHDAILRGNARQRAELYSIQVQNGIKTRNECRQLENEPPDTSPMADALTVQSNLVSIQNLGQPLATGGTNAPAQDPAAQ